MRNRDINLPTERESLLKKELFWNNYPWFMSCSVSSSQTRTCMALPSRHHWNISSIFSLIRANRNLGCKHGRASYNRATRRAAPRSKTASCHTLNIAIFSSARRTLTRHNLYYSVYYSWVTRRVCWSLFFIRMCGDCVECRIPRESFEYSD